MFELTMENFLGVLAIVLAVLIYAEMTAFKLYADAFFGWINLRFVGKIFFNSSFLPWLAIR